MNVNQNDVRPYLTNILEGNHNIRFTIEKIENLIAAGNHNFANAAAAGIKLQIAYLTQLFTVFGIDHIFAFQLGK